MGKAQAAGAPRSDYRVANIEDTKFVRDWYAKYHYSGTAGNGQVGRIGYYRGDELLAVVSFGNPTNVYGLARKLELSDWKGNIELSRLAVHPDAPPNTASQAVAAALTYIGEQGYEWVFSYADTGQGHHGGIYQALNGVYVGRSPGVILYTLNGVRFHNRNAAEQFGSNRFPHERGILCPGINCPHRRCAGYLAAKAGAGDLQKDWEGSSDKHTYILVTAQNKRDRKQLRDHLQQFAMPYPKRDGVGDVTRARVASGGAEPASTGGIEQAPAAAEVATSTAPRSNLHLYPYQRVGAAFLATARNALLGDEMGVGKTAQTIRALQLLASVGESVFPALVVAPATVKRVWEREFDAWWPGVRVAVPRSGTAAATAAVADAAAGAVDVVVLNYEALTSVSRLAPYGSVRLEGCVNCDPLSQRNPSRCQKERKPANEVPWRTVIADEAHRIKDPHTQQTRALWALGDPAEFRFALTGTPIANAPDDLWAVMRFVSPTEYARKTGWIERYVETVPNPFSGYADPVGFRADRRAEFDSFFLPRFLRRPKAAVLPDLPPKTYMTRWVDLGSKQRGAYDQLRRTLIARVEDGTIFAENPLVEMLRLRQLASAFGVADGVGGMVVAEPSSKLDDLEDVLAELGDRQAVVFAESRQLIELAAERLGDRAVQITGAVPQNERTENLDAFQAGDVLTLLCTIAAGGVGLTMTAADTAIFLQRSWSAVLNLQAEDRIHRIGQTAENVTIVDLVAVDTVEERVAEVLTDKAARLEDLVRDADTLRRWLA